MSASQTRLDEVDRQRFGRGDHHAAPTVNDGFTLRAGFAHVAGGAGGTHRPLFQESGLSTFLLVAVRAGGARCRRRFPSWSPQRRLSTRSARSSKSRTALQQSAVLAINRAPWQGSLGVEGLGDDPSPLELRLARPLHATVETEGAHLPDARELIRFGPNGDSNTRLLTPNVGTILIEP